METFRGIPGYTTLESLGEGGFAKVIKVRDDEFGYIRAIRILKEPIISENSETYKKFKRECNLLLRLGNGNHPNIIHIWRPRLIDGWAMVEMDYVDGLDIFKYIEKEHGFVDVKEVINMSKQISSALAYCHEDIYKACMDRDIDNLQDDPNDGSRVIIDEETRKRLIEKYKVIHNDIHAGNIMRNNDGNYILLDFGLAINGTEVVRSSSRHSKGSPEFKAPEKWNDDKILTEQSDIYSFGVVMYMLLAGRVPFQYDTKGDYMADYKIAEAHQKMTPPDIEAFRKERYEKKYEGKQYKRDYPQWLENAIYKCLEKNPDDRFRNGKELYEFILSHINDNDISEEKTEKKRGKAIKRNNELDEDEMTYLIGKNKELKAQNTDLFNAYNRVNKEKSSLINELDEVKDDVRREKEAYKFLKKQYERLNPLAYKILITVFVVFAVMAFIIVGVKSSTIEKKDKKIADKEKMHFRDSVIINSLRDENNTLKFTNDSLMTVNQQFMENEDNSSALKKRNAALEQRVHDLERDMERMAKEIQEKEAYINRLMN